MWKKGYNLSEFVYVCIQRKPRVAPNPVPTSPTSSTPEPDTSTVPMDNATIPNSALQAPTGTQPTHVDTHYHWWMCLSGMFSSSVTLSDTPSPPFVLRWQRNLTNSELYTQVWFKIRHNGPLCLITITMSSSNKSRSLQYWLLCLFSASLCVSK